MCMCATFHRTHRHVAVKMVKGAATLEDSEEFLGELEMMAPLRHPNVNQLVGVSLRQQPWLAVLDFCPFGDVSLHAN